MAADERDGFPQSQAWLACTQEGEGTHTVLVHQPGQVWGSICCTGSLGLLVSQGSQKAGGESDGLLPPNRALELT